MKKILFLLLLPAVAFIVPEKFVTIKGNIKTSDPVKMIYLAYRVGDNDMSDSTTEKNGEFTFKEKVEEPTIAVLMIKFDKLDGKANTRIERKIVFLEPGNIKISIKDSLKFADVAGSKANNDYERFVQLQKPYEDAMQALGPKYREYQSQKNEEGLKMIIAKADSLTKEKDEKVVKPFLLENINSPIALYVLQQYAGYEIDSKKVEPLFARLPQSTRKLPSSIAFKEQIEIAKKNGYWSVRSRLYAKRRTGPSGIPFLIQGKIYSP